MNRLLLIMAVFLVSCTSEPYFEENTTVDDNTWKHDKPVKIKVPIDGENSKYDIFVNVRNTIDYEYQNLIVFMKISDPDGSPSIDTLQFRVAQENGKWTGEESGALVMNSWLTYEDYTFGKKGTYTFELWHGMADLSLNSITDVGIRLEEK